MARKEIQELGRGSFGRVYLAQDDDFGQVAVKELLDPDFEKDRFRREVSILIDQARNPFVVDIYHFDLDAPRPYMILEYCAGGSLRNWVKKVTWQQAVTMLLHAANGLLAIHREGGFHRDIKPENLLLQILDTGEKITKVADFGVARRPKTALPPMTASAWGTRGYIAPELSNPAILFSAACDIYSLGVVGIELMTGDPDPKSIQASAIPDEFKGLLKRMTSATPVIRPSTADAIIELERLLRPPPAVNIPPQSPPLAPRTVASPQAQSGGTDVLLGALLVAGLAGIAAALVAGNQPEYDPLVDRYRGSDGRFKRRR